MRFRKRNHQIIMSPIKKILLALTIGFVAIQFLQPGHNTDTGMLPTDFAKIYVVPNNVQLILQNACYDCHSNNTTYPWYSKIQPVAWMMARHVKNGKDKLNFSDFGTYTNRRQISKLNGIANQIKDGQMPLSSYKWMHKSANLSQDQKKMIIDWMNSTADSLSRIR